MREFTRVLVVTLWALFTTAYTLSFMFSYLPEMMLWMGYKEWQKGYNVGIIAGSFAFGSFTTNYPLGMLADRHGHQQTLGVLLILNTVFCLCLMFCRSLWTMVTFRFLTGVCNTIFPICRGIVGLFCDETNHTSAMTAVSMAWIIGLYTGSISGGYLVKFSKKYFFSNGYLVTYPYFLPPAVACFFSAVGIVLMFILYRSNCRKNCCEQTGMFNNESSNDEGTSIIDNVNDEKYNTFSNTTRSTNSNSEYLEEKIPLQNLNDSQTINSEENELAFSNSVINPLEDKQNIITNNKTEDNEISDEKQHILKNDKTEDNEISDDKQNIIKNDKTEDIKLSCKNINGKESDAHNRNIILMCFTSIKNSLFIMLLHNHDFVKSFVVYTILSSVMVTFIEMYAVWASTVVYIGGLGYTPDQIANAIGVVVVPSAFVTVAIVPVVERHIGHVRSCVLFMAVIMVSTSLTPQTALVHGIWPQWGVLLLFQFLILVAEVASTAAILVIINNCVEKGEIGAANGLVQTMSSLGRFLGPLLGGTVFSECISSTLGPPIDQNLLFVALGVIMLVACGVAYSLINYCNRSLSLNKT